MTRIFKSDIIITVIGDRMMMDRIELSVLLDYYGKLLTEKQQKIMNLYYNEDLSLSEIAELNNTSRQAIYDLIKRCYKQLLTYEDKLCLMKQDIELESQINLIIDNLNKIQGSNNDDIKIIQDIKSILEKL